MHKFNPTLQLTIFQGGYFISQIIVFDLVLEPDKMPINKAKTEALTSVRAHWLRW